jgi:hypothetical protein
MHTVAGFQNVKQALANINMITGLANQEPLFQQGGTVADVRARPDMLQMFAAYFGAPTIGRARIIAQSMFDVFPSGGPDFFRLNRGATPQSPTPFVDLRFNPVPFDAKDIFNVQVDNNGAAGAENVYAGLWFCDAPPRPDPGKWRPWRFTTTASAMTASVWNNRTLTSTQTLKPGRYQVGGAWAFGQSAGSSLIFGRLANLLRPGDVVAMAERPGFICGATPDQFGPAPFDQNDGVFRNGTLGVWGEFTHDQLPSIDFLPNAADNQVQEVFLDIRRVA